MEGEQADPNGVDGFTYTDQDIMDEEVNNMQDIYQQDTNEQPFDDTFPDENDPYIDADSSLDPTSEAANNVGDGTQLERIPEDEGDGEFLAEAEVRGWDQKQTAGYLRQLGVDQKHCQAFEEKGITGDSLLSLGQDSMVTQYLNFGARGKRLKTSGKIRQFQQDLLAGGALRDPPTPIIESAVEQTEASDNASLQNRSFKHPYTWRHGMAEKLQVDETRDIQSEELLGDLLETMTARDRPRGEDGDLLSTREQAKFRSGLSKDETGGVERATSSMCADLLDKFNAHRRVNKYRPTTNEDDILWLRIGVQQFKLRTSKCIHAFPSGDYTESFPIAAIMPMNEDFYEPAGTIGLERLEKYWSLRKQSSRSAEQAAILLAMTQAQARVLDLGRFKADRHDDSRLQTLQSFLLVVDKQNVQIVRCFSDREYIDAVNSPSCREIPRDIPKGLSLHIERSAPLDVRDKDGWHKLLSGIKALVCSYDLVEPLVASRRPLVEDVGPNEESDPMYTPQDSEVEEEPEYEPSNDGEEPLLTPEELSREGEEFSGEEGPLEDEEAYDDEEGFEDEPFDEEGEFEDEGLEDDPFEDEALEDEPFDEEEPFDEGEPFEEDYPEDDYPLDGDELGEGFQDDFPEDEGAYGDDAYGDEDAFDDDAYGDEGAYDDDAYGDEGAFDDDAYGDEGAYDDDAYGDERAYGDDAYGDDGMYGGDEGGYGDDGLYGGDEGAYANDDAYGDDDGMYGGDEGAYGDDGMYGGDKGAYGGDDGMYGGDAGGYGDDDMYGANERAYDDDAMYGGDDGAYGGDDGMYGGDGGGYGDEGAYGDQAGYEAGYEDEGAYASEGAYGDQGGYEAGYGDEGAYGNEDAYGAKTGYGDEGAYGVDDQYGDDGTYEDGAYEAETGYGEDRAYGANDVYGNQDAYADEGVYGDNDAYRGDEIGYDGDAGYGDEPGYGNQDAYEDEGVYRDNGDYAGDETAYNENSGYRDEPKYGDEDAYGDENVYREDEYDDLSQENYHDGDVPPEDDRYAGGLPEADYREGELPLENTAHDDAYRNELPEEDYRGAELPPVDDAYGDRYGRGPEGDDYDGEPQMESFQDDRYGVNNQDGYYDEQLPRSELHDEQYSDRATDLDSLHDYKVDDDVRETDIPMSGAGTDYRANDYPQDDYHREEPFAEKYQDNDFRHELSGPTDDRHIDEFRDNDGHENALLSDDHRSLEGSMAGSVLDNFPIRDQHFSHQEYGSEDENMEETPVNDMTNGDLLRNEEQDLSGYDQPIRSPLGSVMNNNGPCLGEETVDQTLADGLRSGNSVSYGGEEDNDDDGKRFDSMNDDNANRFGRLNDHEPPFDDSQLEDGNLPSVGVVNQQAYDDNTAKVGYQSHEQSKERLSLHDQVGDEGDTLTDNDSLGSPLEGLSSRHDVVNSDDLQSDRDARDGDDLLPEGNRIGKSSEEYIHGRDDVQSGKDLRKENEYSSDDDWVRGVPAQNLGEEDDLARQARLGVEEDCYSDEDNDGKHHSAASNVERHIGSRRSPSLQSFADDFLHDGVDPDEQDHLSYTDGVRSSGGGLNGARSEGLNTRSPKRDERYGGDNYNLVEPREENSLSGVLESEHNNKFGRHSLADDGLGQRDRGSVDYADSAYEQNNYGLASPVKFDKESVDGEDFPENDFRDVGDRRADHNGGHYGSSGHPELLESRKDNKFNSPQNEKVDYEGDGYGGNDYSDDEFRERDSREDFKQDQLKKEEYEEDQLREGMYTGRGRRKGNFEDEYNDDQTDHYQSQRLDEDDHISSFRSRDNDTKIGMQHNSEQGLNDVLPIVPQLDQRVTQEQLFSEDEDGVLAESLQSPHNIGQSLPNAKDLAKNAPRLDREYLDSGKDVQNDLSPIGGLSSDEERTTHVTRKEINDRKSPHDSREKSLDSPGLANSGLPDFAPSTPRLGERSRPNNFNSLVLRTGGAEWSQSDEEAFEKFVQASPRDSGEQRSSTDTSGKSGHDSTSPGHLASHHNEPQSPPSENALVAGGMNQQRLLAEGNSSFQDDILASQDYGRRSSDKTGFGSLGHKMLASKSGGSGKKHNVWDRTHNEKSDASDNGLDQYPEKDSYRASPSGADPNAALLEENSTSQPSEKLSDASFANASTSLNGFDGGPISTNLRHPPPPPYPESHASHSRDKNPSWDEPVNNTSRLGPPAVDLSDLRDSEPRSQSTKEDLEKSPTSRQSPRAASDRSMADRIPRNGRSSLSNDDSFPLEQGPIADHKSPTVTAGKNGKAGKAIDKMLSSLEESDTREVFDPVAHGAEASVGKQRKAHADLDNLLATLDGKGSKELHSPNVKPADSGPHESRKAPQTIDNLMTDLTSVPRDTDERWREPEKGTGKVAVSDRDPLNASSHDAGSVGPSWQNPSSRSASNIGNALNASTPSSQDSKLPFPQTQGLLPNSRFKDDEHGGWPNPTDRSEAAFREQPSSQVHEPRDVLSFPSESSRQQLRGDKEDGNVQPGSNSSNDVLPSSQDSSFKSQQPQRSVEGTYPSIAPANSSKGENETPVIGGRTEKAPISMDARGKKPPFGGFTLFPARRGLPSENGGRGDTSLSSESLKQGSTPSQAGKEGQNNPTLPTTSFIKPQTDDSTFARSVAGEQPLREATTVGFSEAWQKPENTLWASDAKIMPQDKNDSATISTLPDAGANDIQDIPRKDNVPLPPQPLRMGLPSRPVPGRKSTFAVLPEKAPGLSDSSNAKSPGVGDKVTEVQGRSTEQVPRTGTNNIWPVLGKPSDLSTDGLPPRGRFSPLGQRPSNMNEPFSLADKGSSQPVSRNEVNETAKEVDGKPSYPAMLGTNTHSTEPSSKSQAQTTPGDSRRIDDARQMPQAISKNSVQYNKQDWQPTSINGKVSMPPPAYGLQKPESSESSKENIDPVASTTSLGNMALSSQKEAPSTSASVPEKRLTSPFSRGGLPMGPRLSTIPPKRPPPPAQSLPPIPSLPKPPFATNVQPGPSSTGLQTGELAENQSSSTPFGGKDSTFTTSANTPAGIDTRKGPLADQSKGIFFPFGANNRPLPPGLQTGSSVNSKEGPPGINQQRMPPVNGQMPEKSGFGLLNGTPPPGAQNGPMSSTSHGIATPLPQGKLSGEGSRGSSTAPGNINQFPLPPAQYRQTTQTPLQPVPLPNAQDDSKGLGTQSYTSLPKPPQLSNQLPRVPPPPLQGQQAAAKPTNTPSRLPFLPQSHDPVANSAIPTSAFKAPTLQQDVHNGAQNHGSGQPVLPKNEQGMPTSSVQRGSPAPEKSRAPIFPGIQQKVPPFGNSTGSSVSQQNGLRMPPKLQTENTSNQGQTPSSGPGVAPNPANSNVSISPSGGQLSSKPKAPFPASVQQPSGPPGQQTWPLPSFSQKTPVPQALPPPQPTSSTNLPTKPSGPMFPSTLQDGKFTPTPAASSALPKGALPPPNMALKGSTTPPTNMPPRGGMPSLPNLTHGTLPASNGLPKGQTPPPGMSLKGQNTTNPPQNGLPSLPPLDRLPNSSAPSFGDAQKSAARPIIRPGPQASMMPQPEPKPPQPSLGKLPDLPGSFFGGAQQQGQPSKPTDAPVPSAIQKASTPPAPAAMSFKAMPMGTPQLPPINAPKGPAQPQSGNGPFGAQNKLPPQGPPQGSSQQQAGPSHSMLARFGHNGPGLFGAQPKSEPSSKVQGGPFQPGSQKLSPPPNQGQPHATIPDKQAKPIPFQSSQPLNAEKPLVVPDAARDGISPAGKSSKPLFPSTTPGDQPANTQNQTVPQRLPNVPIPVAGQRKESTTFKPPPPPPPLPLPPPPPPPSGPLKELQASQPNRNFNPFRKFTNGIGGSNKPQATLPQSTAPAASQVNLAASSAGGKANPTMQQPSVPPQKAQTGIGGFFSGSKPLSNMIPGETPQNNAPVRSGLLGSSKPATVMPPGIPPPVNSTPDPKNPPSNPSANNTSTKVGFFSPLNPIPANTPSNSSSYKQTTGGGFSGRSDTAPLNPSNISPPKNPTNGGGLLAGSTPGPAGPSNSATQSDPSSRNRLFGLSKPNMPVPNAPTAPSKPQNNPSNGGGDFGKRQQPAIMPQAVPLQNNQPNNSGGFLSRSKPVPIGPNASFEKPAPAAPQSNAPIASSSGFMNKPAAPTPVQNKLPQSGSGELFGSKTTAPPSNQSKPNVGGSLVFPKPPAQPPPVNAPKSNQANSGGMFSNVWKSADATSGPAKPTQVNQMPAPLGGQSSKPTPPPSKPLPLSSKPSKPLPPPSKSMPSSSKPTTPASKPMPPPTNQPLQQKAQPVPFTQAKGNGSFFGKSGSSDKMKATAPLPLSNKLNIPPQKPQQPSASFFRSGTGKENTQSSTTSQSKKTGAAIGFSNPGYVKPLAAVSRMGNMSAVNGTGKGKSSQQQQQPKAQKKVQLKSQPKSQSKSQTKPQGKSHKNIITFVNGKQTVV